MHFLVYLWRYILHTRFVLFIYFWLIFKCWFRLKCRPTWVHQMLNNLLIYWSAFQLKVMITHLFTWCRSGLSSKVIGHIIIIVFFESLIGHVFTVYEVGRFQLNIKLDILSASLTITKDLQAAMQNKLCIYDFSTC